MNVYDFDGTIYDGDSSLDFYKYCLKHCGLWRTLPKALWNLALLALRLRDKTAAKQNVYGYFRYIPDINATLEEFWKENERKLKKWYTEDKLRKDDLIISASPEFQLKPICDKLGVRLIASRVDKHSGVYTGVNCSGREKVRRFYEVFPGGRINEFYSDSRIDEPLARLADSAFMVRHDDIAPWSFR